MRSSQAKEGLLVYEVTVHQRVDDDGQRTEQLETIIFGCRHHSRRRIAAHEGRPIEDGPRQPAEIRHAPTSRRTKWQPDWCCLSDTIARRFHPPSFVKNRSITCQKRASIAQIREILGVFDVLRDTCPAMAFAIRPVQVEMTKPRSDRARGS